MQKSNQFHNYQRDDFILYRPNNKTYCFESSCRVFSAFTMDVIARCAFGLQIDTLGENDDPFIANAKHVFHAPANKTPLILLPSE